MTTSIDAALALDPVSSGIFPPSVVLFSLRGSALFALRTFFSSSSSGRGAVAQF
jgi:hypothetical protein